MDVLGLRVAELRAELEKRGLDSSGRKAELQERLQKTLEREQNRQSATAAAARSPPLGTTGATSESLALSGGRGGPTGSAAEAGAAPAGSGVAQGERPSAPETVPDDAELEPFLTNQERTEVDKTRERATRFGMPYQGMPAELRAIATRRRRDHLRLQRVLRRQGGVVPLDEAEQERRRCRMERFGLNKPLFEVEIEERERRMRERLEKKRAAAAAGTAGSSGAPSAGAGGAARGARTSPS